MSWWNPLTWFAAKEPPRVVVLDVPIPEIPDDHLDELHELLGHVLGARTTLRESVPEPTLEAPTPDLIGWATSVRNRILAGSGMKAELFGTISTPATMTAVDMERWGLTAEQAKALADERDAIVAVARDLDAAL